MSSPDRFPFSSRTVPGGSGRQVGRLVRCVCGFEGFVADTSKGGLPPEVVAKQFARRGWRIGKAASQDRCPNCLGTKPTLTPKQRRAAYCRIAGVPRAGELKETPMSDASTQAVRDAERAAADAPREPTREDRRRILDALETAYLVEPGRYAKDGSDEKLATALNVPRAWVSAIRDDLFGPDVNEAAAQRELAISEVERLADELEKRILKSVDDLAAIRGKIAGLKA